MKYEFMQEYRDRFRLKSMCKVLKVSRSGYYAWKSRTGSNRQQINEKLLSSIREVYKKSRKVYGSPRITDELNDNGLRCGKNRVARIMKEHGIRAYIRKKFRRTTDSRHRYPASPNLLMNGKKE